jgi:hypothetical protein
MGLRLLRPCRKEDPLLKIVRDTYHAQPVGAPRGDVDFLHVLVDRGNGTFAPWGPLAALLTRQPPLDQVLGPPKPQVAHDLSGKQSGSVRLSAGLEILGALLTAFGVPVPGVEASFESTRALSFRFSRVTERLTTAAELGNALHGRRLRKSNVASRLLTEKGTALIITSVLESPELVVSAHSTRGANAGVKILPIKEAIDIGEADLEAQVRRGKELVLTSQSPAVFGFRCLRLDISQDGDLDGVGLGPKRVVVSALSQQLPIIYASEPGGLDPDSITSGRRKVTRRGGIVEAVAVEAGPTVVNASPVLLASEPSILVSSYD